MSAGSTGKRSVRVAVSMLIAFSFFFLLWGCATPHVDPKLVAQFKPPVTPTDQETMVYVIRTSGFVGAARSVWVACNDHYMAELASGSYAYFKVPAGLNTINIEQTGIPLAWNRVDDRPGETVFFKHEYTKGSLVEVPRDQGITLVMLYEQARKYKSNEKSDRYQTGLVNPGLLGLNLMKAATEGTGFADTTGFATITFIRPQGFVKEMPLSVWDEKGWVGSLNGETYFQIRVPPGEHLFFCKGEAWSACKADVEAGRHYIVEVEISRGWQQADIHFAEAKKAVQNGDVKEWFGASAAMTRDEAVVNASVQKRLEAAMPLVRKAVEMVADGGLTPIPVAAMDGR